MILAGGLLPFGSIFIEMYFVFTSFWAYKIYYVFGFMLLVVIILAIVTVCVTIVCTYFLLNSEVSGCDVAMLFLTCSSGLPLALDKLPCRRVDGALRLSLLHLLLLLQDQDVRLVPNLFLLWLQRHVCPRPRNSLR